MLLVENIIDGGFSNEFPDVLKLEELVNYYKSKKINLITTHHRFDFLNDTDEVESFKDVIKNNIKKLQKLYPIDGYPKNWYNLQQKLSDLRINNKTITYQQYIEIAKDKEFDISNPDAFLNHFIDNGLVGYYPELSNQIILQMDWVLDAMYACLKLKNNPLLRTKGKLNKDDFDLVWQNYNAKEKKLFLNYMQASHLLYKVNGSIHREYQYLLPALFAEKSKRDKIEWHEKPTYIVIKFGFVFGSIMQQLQVRILNHCHIEEEETFFKNYISFTDKNNQDAYIEMIIEEKELRILCGNERLRQTLLTELNEIYPLDRVAIFSKSGEKEISYQFDRKEKKLFSDIELENSKIKEEMTTIKEVKTFVTYSWTDKDGKFDEVHQKRVGRFVNQLIEKWSIDATFDLFESESNFIKMMYDNLFKNDKIIIVLSEGYAIKANNFKLSGVETEYTAIINDIKKNPTKYILVAFDSREGDIYPFGFQGNDTILINGDLLDNVLNNREQERLLSKLIDEPVYEKPKKGNNRPSIIKKKF